MDHRRLEVILDHALKLVEDVYSFVRTYFITGMLLVVPMGATIYITFLLFDFADRLLGDAVASAFGTRIFGLGLLATIVLFVLVGMVAQNWVTQALLRALDGALERLPIARSIYVGIKQINDILFSQKNSLALSRVVLVEYPKDDSWVLAFHTGNLTPGVTDGFGVTAMCTVFVPTTPNPTSGFMLIVPENRVIATKLTYEDAMKMIVTGGLLKPPVVAGPVPDGPPRDDEFIFPH